jgi:hypothetical protein
MQEMKPTFDIPRVAKANGKIGFPVEQHFAEIIWRHIQTVACTPALREYAVSINGIVLVHIP